MDKQCFKCGERKPIDEFYRHSEMGDGHLNKCKQCTKSDVTANRLRRLAHYRKYDIERSTAPDRRRTLTAVQSRMRQNHPEKSAAHRKVRWAVKSGRLVRQPCEKCGNFPTAAHHDDYSKPLDVRWLCSKCHRIEHGAAAMD